MFPFGTKTLQEFVKIWDRKFPIDRWYRQRYNIPFGSSAHKNTNLVDMFIDFYEFIYLKSEINKLKEKEETEEKIFEEKYIRGKGNFMKSNNLSLLSKREIDELFDNLDIDKL